MAGAAIPRAQNDRQRSLLLPFALAAAVTVLIGVAVSMEPYFAGDVAVARAVQRASPAARLVGDADQQPRTGAKPVLRDGHRGAAVVTSSPDGGAWRSPPARSRSSSSAPNQRRRSSAGRGPRASLITVVGNPSGFTFPSTTITFFCATFGTVAVLSARKAATPLNGVTHGRRVDHGGARLRRAGRARRALAERCRAHVGRSVSPGCGRRRA